MIASGNWKKEFHTRAIGNIASTSTNIEAMLQKLSNELIALNK